MKFILTDFINDIEVFYRGATKFEFKEGETLILNAYMPDKRNKNKVIYLLYVLDCGNGVQHQTLNGWI